MTHFASEFCSHTDLNLWPFDLKTTLPLTLINLDNLKACFQVSPLQ